MLQKSSVTVQHWVDSISVSSNNNNKNRNSINSTPQTNMSVCHSPAKLIRGVLARDVSIQSDDVSHCSSLESMLELRKPDPEAVLLGLGFGPSESNTSASRIPQRFLSQSKLIKNMDIQKFLEQQGEHQVQESSQFNSLPGSPAHARPKSF